MKRLTIANFITVSMLVLFVGCNEFVSGDKFENDPNSPTDAPEDLQISGSQIALGLFFESEGNRLANMWSDQFTGSERQYASLENYNVAQGEFNGPWGDAYSGVVQQTRIVQDKAAEVNNLILQGIAQVMEAQVMGTVTALWGDVPFEEAANVEEFPNPTYDAQSDVYNSVQSLLDDAIANIESGEGVPPESDIFFAGDPDSWLQVAHTLKARYYLHTGNHSEALDHADQGITDPEDSMLMPHGGAYGGDLNTFYSFGQIDRLGYMTASNAYAVSQFEDRQNDKTDESERSAFYYDGGNLNYGGFFGFAASFPLVTFEENQLILAESELEANGDELAAIDELNVLRSHLQDTYPDGTYEDYTIVDFETGGTARDGADSTEDAIRTEIFEERYFSLLAQYEAFIDIQRSDNILDIEPSGSNEQIPARFLYPQSEINSNENTPDQSSSELFDPLPVFE